MGGIHDLTVTLTPVLQFNRVCLNPTLNKAGLNGSPTGTGW